LNNPSSIIDKNCIKICIEAVFQCDLVSGADTEWGAGDAFPHQTWRGVDMTLDFIENHRQKCFCTAHYLIAKDSKNNLC